MTRVSLPKCLAASVALLLLPSAATIGQEGKEIQPFSGKDLNGWSLKQPVEKSHWVVGYARPSSSDPKTLEVSQDGDGPPQLINKASGGVDAYTNQKWGDQTISLELMVPKGSNSGVYVQGEYEVQVLDSFGKDKVGPGDLGGLYNAAAPKVNAAKKPGEWQTMVIEFQAPKFDGDKKVQNAKFVKVTLNGQVIHENVEMKGPTPGGVTGKEAAKGPLMFQGNHGPVAYRNIKIFVKK
jgi:hypothetical protein